MFGAYYAGQSYAGQSGKKSANILLLLVGDTSHSQTAQALDLQQIYNMIVSNATHSQTADNITLERILSLLADSTIHTQTASDAVIFVIERKKPATWAESDDKMAQTWVVYNKLPAQWQDNDNKVGDVWTNTGEKTAATWQKTPVEQTSYWRDSFGD